MHVAGSKVRVAESSKLFDPGKEQGLMFTLLGAGFVLVYYYPILPQFLPFGAIGFMLCNYMLQYVNCFLF